MNRNIFQAPASSREFTSWYLDFCLYKHAVIDDKKLGRQLEFRIQLRGSLLHGNGFIEDV